jgi:hypothetical protein
MRSYVAVLVVLTPFALISGCGESEQAKAESTVCEGKKEISDSVSSLQSMTLTNASVSAGQGDLKSIESGLNKMNGAVYEMSGEHKEAVKKATVQLSSELSTIANELTNLTLPQALTEVTAAAEKLVRSYKQTFTSIQC